METEINIGDYWITFTQNGYFEVWSKSEKRFLYEGTLDELFKSKAALKAS